MKQIGMVILGILAGLLVACGPAAGRKTLSISPIGSLSSGATSQVADAATISAESAHPTGLLLVRGTRVTPNIESDRTEILRLAKLCA